MSTIFPARPDDREVSRGFDWLTMQHLPAYI